MPKESTAFHIELQWVCVYIYVLMGVGVGERRMGRNTFDGPSVSLSGNCYAVQK